MSKNVNVVVNEKEYLKICIAKAHAQKLKNGSTFLGNIMCFLM
jgi:hypothetical protein